MTWLLLSPFYKKAVIINKNSNIKLFVHHHIVGKYRLNFINLTPKVLLCEKCYHSFLKIKTLPINLDLNLISHNYYWAFLVAQMVKNVPPMQETRAQPLGWEDILEKEMATHSSTLAWRIPWTQEPGKLRSMGSPKVGHD